MLVALLALSLSAAPGASADAPPELPRPAPRASAGTRSSTAAELLQGALDAALAVADGRAEVLAAEGALPPDCAFDRAAAARPVTASGRAALYLGGSDPSGRECGAWLWARVRVNGPTLVTTRAVAEGEPLAGSVAVVEREIVAGHPSLGALPEGAHASRSLPAGISLDPAAIRLGPRLGETVTVALRSGDLLVEERGHAVACRRGRACALLPSGRRLEGDWHDGRIVIGSP